jgi:spore coat protein U-like protein
MKKIALVVALGVAGLVSGVANAGTASGKFDVNITLHTKCQLSKWATDYDGAGIAYDPSWGGGISTTSSQVGTDATSGLPTTVAATPVADVAPNTYTQALNNLSMTYTSFQTADSLGATTFAVRCTTGQTYSVGIHGSSGVQTTYTGGDEVPDTALALRYKLYLTDTATAPASYAAAEQSYVPGNTGGGLTAKTFYVYGTIEGGQSGTCGTPSTVASCTNASATNKTRYVTVEF